MSARAARTTFRGVTPGRDVPFKTSLPQKIALPVEANPWFWFPGKVGVSGAPDWFRRQLREFDRDLTVTWNQWDERWQVWMKSPRSVHRYGRGWMLLFPVRASDGGYAPLDNRVFARLYSASIAKWGNGKRYFDRIEAEMARDKARYDQNRDGDVAHAAGEFYGTTQPSISMYGRSRGDKCAALDSQLSY